MSFKVGDKVLYTNGDSAYDKEIGTVLNFGTDVSTVDFGTANCNCSNCYLELAKPTTLEKLVEFQKSGELFELEDWAGEYRFVNGKLYSNESPLWETRIEFNDVIIRQIKKSPWKPQDKEIYFFIDTETGNAIQTNYMINSNYDNAKIELGNYFKTKKLAEAVGIAKILKKANHG